MGNTTSITAHDRAILQLKKQRDALKQHQKKLDSTIAHDSTLAKQAVATNPQRAKFYLKHKRQQLDLLGKTLIQLETIETLISTIEFKLVEKDVMELLQQGNQVLKHLNQQVSVDKVDEIMDTFSEERVKADEVTDALGLGGEEYDVDDELAALEEEMGANRKVVKDKIQQEHVPSMPEVPSQVPLQDVPVGKLQDVPKEPALAA